MYIDLGTLVKVFRLVRAIPKKFPARRGPGGKDGSENVRVALVVLLATLIVFQYSTHIKLFFHSYPLKCTDNCPWMYVYVPYTTQHCLYFQNLVNVGCWWLYQGFGWIYGYVNFCKVYTSYSLCTALLLSIAALMLLCFRCCHGVEKKNVSYTPEASRESKEKKRPSGAYDVLNKHTLRIVESRIAYYWVLHFGDFFLDLWWRIIPACVVSLQYHPLKRTKSSSRIAATILTVIDSSKVVRQSTETLTHYHDDLLMNERSPLSSDAPLYTDRAWRRWFPWTKIDQHVHPKLSITNLRLLIIDALNTFLIRIVLFLTALELYTGCGYWNRSEDKHVHRTHFAVIVAILAYRRSTRHHRGISFDSLPWCLLKMKIQFAHCHNKSCIVNAREGRFTNRQKYACRFISVVLWRVLTSL